VYVYRDAAAQAGYHAVPAAEDPAEADTAYWYDLLAEHPVPRREEARGPFEPLMSASESPDAAAEQPSEIEPAPAPDRPSGSAPAARHDAGPPEDPQTQPDARAQKLEQIKEFYLTAEAIGEENVERHFDQLLARQRELISEYFSQSAAGGPAAADPDATDGFGIPIGAEPIEPGQAGGPSGAPQRAGVAAEYPHAW
jgi:hypothetical protein